MEKSFVLSCGIRGFYFNLIWRVEMYLSYDTQSSHEGYIDMEFKEIVDDPPSEHSEYLSDTELFDAIVDGYYYEGTYHKMPKHIKKVFDFEGDYASARVSKRLIKAWCKKVCS